MDWKYILSLNVEDVNDDEKDELYNSVTWFDCDGANLDENKYKALVRVCQEILKYKGEQVETLLHELEEMAVKQVEDESRRHGSEADLRSSRSKKSSSIEYENLEQKYLETKSKLKKANKINEKQEAEMNKLNNKLKLLEQENRRLQNEIQSRPNDIGGSESDISESIKDKKKELVESLHNKNMQISDLLRDIEEVENENSVLRDKLSKVRDELSVATEEILSLTDLLKEKESVIAENNENFNKITSEIDILRNDFESLQNEKVTLEEETNKTVEDLNKKIIDMQTELISKEDEIQNLKTRLKEPSLNSSLSSLPKDEPEKEQTPSQSHLAALQKALNDREAQLMDVQSHLQIATKEMESVTAVLTRLKSQKKEEEAKVKTLTENNLELKKQLKTVHERCQKLHDELSFAEETVRSKDDELKHILEKMQDDGQVDLAINLNAIKELKTDNRLKEKHIISLVRVTNKLQETCDLLEKENSSLRESLGIPQDDTVNLSGYTSKQKKLKKEIEYLKHQLSNKEETILQLKTENHKINKTSSSLCNQILELGHKPSYESKHAVSDDISRYSKDEMKSLAEENEALRKGLHEIMDSIKNKKSQLEIKSETFEQLLRTLDVKHITGWYHPAMRLQADLHNLEGINSELREQLRQARNEIRLKKIKNKDEHDEGVDQKDEIDTVTGDSGVEFEETLLENIDETVRNLFFAKKSNLDFIHRQVLVWLQHSAASKTKLEEDLEISEDKLKILQEEHDIVLEKLKILISETDEEKVKKINDVITTNVSLNRKLVYLENESKKLCTRIENLEKDLINVEKNYMKSLTDAQNNNKHLEANLKVLQNLNSTSISFEAYKELEKNLNNTTLKYRDLVTSLQKQEENKCLQLDILLETQKSLESDKNDLITKLEHLKSQEALFAVQNFTEKEEKLAQRLADTEMKEITERQRANHINNLYELVKEQLRKSEEKFAEFSKFNEELLKKNLSLQEQLKDVEEKLCDYIDRTAYNQLENNNSELVKEQERLTIKINNLETELKTLKLDKDYEKTWNDSKEQELLNLKHQIVDLISISDDKVIIAQLSGDVLQNRKLVEFYKISLNGLNEELEKVIEKNDEAKRNFEKEKCLLDERDTAMKKKIEHLQNLLNQQILQFYGYVPLISDEIYVNNVVAVNKQKHETFLALQKTKELENEANILKDKLHLELEYARKQKEIGTDSYKDEYKKMSNWMQEKKAFQISELRLKRQSEFKESQLQHYIERVKIQDDQILKLDQELLQIYKNFDTNVPQKLPSPPQITIQEDQIQKLVTPAPVPLPRKITRSVSIQVSEPDSRPEPSEEKGILVNLKAELLSLREEIGRKESQIDQLKSKITEHEMTISMFRKQIGDKQSQISFYERHIMELQNKKAEVTNAGGAGGDNINVRSDASQSEEVLILKNTLKTLQENIKSKDEELMKYQTLLKIDRDKHSLAAATLQEELQNLQKQLSEEKQNVKSLEENYANTRPNRAALEQYIGQVHALENHMSELHTKLSTVEAQLQSSRQEAVRWRNMANDRLAAMEDLRKNLDQQHQTELEIYKSDTEKLKEIGNDEINSLRQLVLKQRGELTGRLDSDIQRLIREKDDKIHEMIIKLRQIKNVKKPEPIDLDLSPKKVDLESAKEQLLKENELLRKRFEQLLAKEKIAREEINNLKFQLLKKPISARSDKSDKSIKDQLQKKIANLEKEVSDLKQNLNEQIAINETHKIQATEDFNKWKKMKHFQQSADKLKNKLKERDVEFEKLQQTSAGYRLLIERLEREKRNLENRVKTLKSSSMNVGNTAEIESLKLENMKLTCDLSALRNKMEMQQRHAGALGATMLQEKLEGQERKIAILELATRGTSELRSELERLQTSNSTLQKCNLRLEAENLDLKLDLEKSNKEVPHLQQQIHHLENYVDVLKNENSKQQSNVNVPQPVSTETKKVSELERTVFILKRVVEKLQSENKRLVSGKRPLSDRSPSAEKLKRDFLRLKEQHAACGRKIEILEKELEVTKNTLKNVSISKRDNDRIVTPSSELNSVKEQLRIKCGLLDKVKVLLHRAASKEQSLLQEINELKRQRGLVVSPIPEESEQSSLSDAT